MARVAQPLSPNQFAAAVADVALVAHAAPGSKTERLCGTLVARQQPLLTLDDPANHDLIARGARPITAGGIASWWAGQIAGEEA